MEWDEPIPPFHTRYPHKPESCLLTPFQTFGKKDLYRTLISKAAILFFSMSLTFLAKNEKWFRVDNQEFYNFAVWVAESPASVKEQTVRAIEVFLKKHLVDFRN